VRDRKQLELGTKYQRLACLCSFLLYPTSSACKLSHWDLIAWCFCSRPR